MQGHDVDIINKHVTIACYDNIAYRHKDLAHISNRNRIIAHFVPNVVAVATRKSSGVNMNDTVRLAIPKNYTKTKNYDSILYTAKVMSV